MKKISAILSTLLILALTTVSYTAWSQHKDQGQSPSGAKAAPSSFDAAITANSNQMLESGKHIFRFDTFGDEAFWGDTLRLHQAIAGEKLGGVGGLESAPRPHYRSASKWMWMLCRPPWSNN